MEEYSVVVRDYRAGDEAAVRELLSQSAMATVNTAFLSGLARELTFQLMVLTAALLFIFMGVSLGWCVLSVPGVAAVTYCVVWLCHSYRAAELTREATAIPRLYMSSSLTGFWVAELSSSLVDPPQGRYTVLHQPAGLSPSRRRTIVGTIAVAQSRRGEGSAWIRRLAVAPLHQRRGVASALVDEAVRFCQEHGYISVELVVSQYHDAARHLFHCKNFDLKQVYHRPIVGSLIAVCMYELSLRLRSSP